MSTPPVKRDTVEIQKALFSERSSKLDKYYALIIGTRSWRALLRYELVTMTAANRSGALGLWLRSRLFPRLLGRCGRNVTFGRDVVLRHPHKIEIGDPSYEEYREIFKRVAQDKRVEYSDQGLAYLLQEWYIKRNRKLRASHPRDLCDQILDISSYLAVPPVMTRDMLDRAAMAYFVDI